MGTLRTSSLLAAVFLAAYVGLLVDAAGWSYEGAHDFLRLPQWLTRLVHLRLPRTTNYTRPANWGGTCASGKKQSPINIGNTRIVDSNFEPLILINYDSTVSGTITNNGHSIQITLDKPHYVLLAGGDLDSVYSLEQIHFHWPSEHTFHGHSYPLEVHFVHYDLELGNISNAVNVPKGIAVLGAMFTEVESEEADVPILKNVNNITYNEKTKVKFNPSHLLTENTNDFYRYHGSLTTPDCQESVVWTMLIDAQPISKLQISKFRKVKDDTGKALEQNNRSIQQQNNRVIFKNSASPITNSLAIIALSLIILKYT